MRGKEGEEGGREGRGDKYRIPSNNSQLTTTFSLARALASTISPSSGCVVSDRTSEISLSSQKLKQRREGRGTGRGRRGGKREREDANFKQLSSSGSPQLICVNCYLLLLTHLCVELRLPSVERLSCDGYTYKQNLILFYPLPLISSFPLSTPLLPLPSLFLSYQLYADHGRPVLSSSSVPPSPPEAMHPQPPSCTPSRPATLLPLVPGGCIRRGREMGGEERGGGEG